MKILNAILTVLFILFALVQLNDPDPWLWVTMYIYVAVMCGMAFLGKYNQPILLAGMLVSIIWAITLSPGVYF